MEIDDDPHDDSHVNHAPSESALPSSPLHRSTRLKGYITLLASSIFNFISANDALLHKKSQNEDWCVFQYDTTNSMSRLNPNPARIRYAKAASMITILITLSLVFIHLDVLSGLDKKLWAKLVGPKSKVELCILAFLTLLWFVTTWFNTTIRGPAGDGKEQFNLYYSTWICCWTSFWTLERWSTASGRASFEQTVRSWPNRCPLWIVTCILSIADFFFALDTSKHWNEGTEGYPYMNKRFSEIKKSEWSLLLCMTSLTFLCSFSFVLAEIFRENKLNKKGVKSDQENFVEGFVLHVLCIIWIVTVLTTTMPDGAASLLGNLYFATWGCSFSVVGQLAWWYRDWRQGIFAVIQEQQECYETAKKAILRREEKRISNTVNTRNTSDDVGLEALEQCSSKQPTQPNTQLLYTVREEAEFDSDCTSRPIPEIHTEVFSFEGHIIGEIDDNDDMNTFTNEQRERLDSGFSSVTVTTISPTSGVKCACRSLFVSALSDLGPDEDEA